MDTVLVRYAEIGTKSDGVQLEMLATLRNRLEERLQYEEISGTVDRIRGRLRIKATPARVVAALVSDLPGVASSSPTLHVDTDLQAVCAATEDLEIGESFGVDTNTAGHHQQTSEEINEIVGAHIEDRTGATVDLDSPATWVEIDFRESGAYVFTDRFDGPGGFPVGSQRSLAALVSGGIDSPVAAYEAMTRGSAIVPIYFYNRPHAAGDHLLRFETVRDRLRRFNPAGEWGYYRVDMQPVNEALTTIDTGRMLLHRAVMFRTAEYIADKAGLAGIVTGESIGQKSSQTVRNLERTTSTVDRPIHRPLLTATKDEITQQARELGTFDVSTVDSACQTIAPENPATALDADRFDDLAEQVGLEDLIAAAIENVEFIEE